MARTDLDRDVSKWAERARAERLAAMKAKRGTPAEAERTAAYQEAKRAADAAARAARRAAERENKAADLERLRLAVPDKRREAALAAVELARTDMIADHPDVSEDDIAYEAVQSWVAQLRPTRANWGLAAEVLRVTLGYDVEESLHLLERSR